MMGNVTSYVCGRGSSTTLEQGLKGKTTKSSVKNPEVREHGKTRDSGHLRNRTESQTAFGKKYL